jgi:hypothetical protein
MRRIRRSVCGRSRQLRSRQDRFVSFPSPVSQGSMPPGRYQSQTETGFSAFVCTVSASASRRVLIRRAGARRSGHCPRVHEGHSCHDDGAPSVPLRTNLETASQLAESFTHPADSHSRGAVRKKFRCLFRRNAFPLILDFDSHFVLQAYDANLRNRTSGMTMDIRQRLLHQAKNGGLQIARQSIRVEVT